jgi:hypothetical protein
LDLADELLREGFSPWLDSLAIPRYRLEREKEKSEGRLHRLIRIGINRSNFAVAIMTKRYGRTPWTRLESEWIASRHESDPGFDCRQIILGGEEIKGMGSSLPSTSVPKLAHELAAWWDSRRRAATD